MRKPDAQSVNTGHQHRAPPDPQAIYFREMMAIPMLTVEQEREMGAGMVLARQKIRQLKEKKLPKNDPVLAETIRELEDLEHRMIVGNLRLVAKAANKFRNKGLQLNDLIEEGNIGLMRAVKKYKPEKTYRFATYAMCWILQSMRRALSDKSRTIRLPTHVYWTRWQYDRTVDDLKRKERFNPGYNPLPEEVAEVTGMTTRKIDELRVLPQANVHLDAPIGDDGKGTIADAVADPFSPSPDSETFLKSEKELAKKLLDELNPKEKRVIEGRFGLNAASYSLCDEKTLEEIGTQMNITRERVRQIQNNALRKMKKAADAMDSRLR